MTIRQKVADPSDKRRSDKQLIRQKRQLKYIVYSGIDFDIFCDILHTLCNVSISLVCRRIIIHFETVRATPPQMPQESPPATPKEGPSFVEPGKEAKSMSDEESEKQCDMSPYCITGAKVQAKDHLSASEQ
jgi:hypothetical protein